MEEHSLEAKSVPFVIEGIVSVLGVTKDGVSYK